MAARRATPVPYLDLLPVETWSTVLDFLDTTSLSILCTISKAFRSLAQPKLFSTVHLLLPEILGNADSISWDEDAWEVYQRVWIFRKMNIIHLEEALLRNPRLALAVSSLVLEATAEGEDDFGETTPDIPLQIIRSFVNLRSVTLKDTLGFYTDEELHLIDELVDILCKRKIRELILVCPDRAYDALCGLTDSQLSRIKDLERIEWIVEKSTIMDDEQEAYEPIRAPLLASQQSLTTLSFPFRTYLPQNTHVLLCDLTFPHLRYLTLGSFINVSPDQNPNIDLPLLELRFTKFIVAHPMLELIDLSYATKTTNLPTCHLNPKYRPRSPRFAARFLSRDSLPRLRRFRGNIESILVMDEAAVSSLSRLKELGIDPPTMILGGPQDMHALRSGLESLLVSPRKPKLGVLHIDLRWDGETGKDSIMATLALCAQLWGGSLHTWAGAFPHTVRFEYPDMVKMFGGFSKLKTIYLPPQHIIEAPHPESRPITVIVKLFARASPSLERVRVEEQGWHCPLAESRERGPLTWDEFLVSDSRDICMSRSYASYK